MLLNDFIQYTEQLISKNALDFLWRRAYIYNALQELCNALKDNRNVDVTKFSPAINFWGSTTHDLSIPTVAWEDLCSQLSMEIRYANTESLFQHFNEHSSLYSEEFIELWKNLLSEKNPNPKPIEDQMQKPKFDDLSFITDLPEATKSVAWRSPLESFQSAPHASSSFERQTFEDLDSAENGDYFPSREDQNGPNFDKQPNYTRASAPRFNNNNDDSTLNYNFIFNVAAATLAVNCIASLCVVALALTSVIALSTPAMIGVGVGLGLSTVASAAVAGYSFFKKNNTSNQNADAYDFSSAPYASAPYNGETITEMNTANISAL